MAPNRKNRGGQHQHQHQQQHQLANQQHNNNNNLSRQYDSSDISHAKSSSFEDLQHLDFNKVLQEADGSFQITWKEMLMALTGIALLAILSIFVGVAAGMTISIHYYESQRPVEVRRMNSLETSTMYSGSAAHFKVTTLDPTIASMNVMQHNDRDAGMDLGKVITTTPSGQLKMLMVVDEAIPLPQDSEYSTTTSQSPPSSVTETPLRTQLSSNSHFTAPFKPDTIPVTPEQANLLVPGYSRWKDIQPHIALREPSILPTVCSDGQTVGFDDWKRLKAAVQEANSISAERFMKWSEYFATVGKYLSTFEDDNLYYEEDVVFTICPRAKLRARRGPIYINAENVIIECDGCIIDVGGTHLNFGPHAKNILIRGLTFRNAQTTSVTFYHDGADASFEDCSWFGNAGSNAKMGGVADVNSTSTVNFYRCDINQAPKAPVLSNLYVGASPSLTIRN